MSEKMSTEDRLERVEQVLFDVLLDVGPETFNGRLTKYHTSRSLIEDVKDRRARVTAALEADQFEAAASARRERLAAVGK